MININSFPDPIINYDFENVYAPSDDSYLILDYFKRNITKNYFDGLDIREVNAILDLGTGTGIIAIFFLLIKALYPMFTPKIFASDNLEEALKCAQYNERANNFENEIDFILSDLFKNFPDNLKHSFDVIIFNPPYLPSSKLIDEGGNKKKIDQSWDGGKSGNEILIDFFDNISDYLNIRLNKECLIYYISSTRTKLDALDKHIRERGFKKEVLKKKHVFFEDIILNRIKVAKF